MITRKTYTYIHCNKSLSKLPNTLEFLIILHFQNNFTEFKSAFAILFLYNALLSYKSVYSLFYNSRGACKCITL